MSTNSDKVRHLIDNFWHRIFVTIKLEDLKFKQEIADIRKQLNELELMLARLGE